MVFLPFLGTLVIMDVLGTDWTGFMSNIQTSCLNDHKIEDDLKMYFTKMYTLLKRKSHLHWHIEYFRRYLAEKTCPIGLKGQIFPTIKDPSSDLKKSWENTLSNCSFELMRSLIVQYSQDMITLDQEIACLNTQYLHLTGKLIFIAKWIELKERLEVKNKEIIIKKQTCISRPGLLTIGLCRCAHAQ